MSIPAAWLLAPAVAFASAPSASTSPSGDLPETAEADAGGDAIPVEAPPDRTVRILYTGAAGGIGRARSPVSALRPLALHARTVDAALTEVHGIHGVLARGHHILSVDGTMGSAVAFFDGGDITCVAAPGVVGARDSMGVALLETDAPPVWLAPVAGTRFVRQTCTNAAGTSSTLTSPAESPPPTWTLTDWEVRPAVRGKVALAGQSVPFLVVPDPALDHSRTVHAVSSALHADPTAIYVDAGRSLDGASSVRDGAPSLHRKTALEDYTRLGPSVLVPGATELVVGARAFIEEQAPYKLPYIATNWSTEDPMLELPPTRTVTIDHPEGPIRVAFLGILDPELQDVHAGLEAEGVTITDPIAAVQPVVEALERSEPPPDAIIALTSSSGHLQARIRRELRGIDLLIGDPSMATLRTRAREASLRHLDSLHKGGALTLPMDGLATAELGFAHNSSTLTRVRTVPIDLPFDAPTDPAATAAITTVRAGVYPPLEVPLIGPASADASSEPWTEADWDRLVCTSVRLGTDADIAVLGPLPPAPSVPGPLTELHAVNSLALVDTLEVHKVPGTAIQRLADRVDGVAPVVCGIEPGSRVWKVGARWLDPDRVYRVVTTTTAVATTPVGEILRSLESTRALDQPTAQPVPSPTGPDTPATLRSVALQQLRVTRDAVGGPEGVRQELLVDGPARLDPLWLLRVRRIGVQSQSFEGVDDTAFAEVPETLATSPSSYTLGSEADIAMEFSGPSIWSDVRAVGTFSRVRAGEEDPEELADDLVLTTSHALPGLAFPTVSSLQMMPFSEVAYDTEITAIEEEDGGTGIAQSDLSLTLGISALRSGPIRGLRFGGFVNRDMARLDEKPSEFGGRLDWETFQAFGPSVRWTTAANVLVFADTPDDDPSDLRLRAQADTRVLLPLATWLDLGVYGQVFALRGRTAVNDRLGVSTTWGVTLDMAGAFAL